MLLEDTSRVGVTDLASKVLEEAYLILGCRVTPEGFWQCTKCGLTVSVEVGLSHAETIFGEHSFCGPKCKTNFIHWTNGLKYDDPILEKIPNLFSVLDGLILINPTESTYEY